MSDNFFWEPSKAARVLAERGITFEEVQTVFEDDYLDIVPDLAHSIGEARYTAVGTSKQGRLLVVTFTERGDTIRIITARAATPKERRPYETYRPLD
ncbi:MAG: BrnT family toxin [Acidobacteria bacterium]|nr:BrnT family toxin [Acidobacteriota bacterium]MBI3424574.1 BrnT family toxin [Acidobacteriota bacterium]